MKKLLSLLVALMLVLSGVSALAEAVLDENGAVSNPEELVAGDNELMFWSLFSGGEGAVMEKFVADYNATNPEYTVRNVQLDWGQYYTKLTTAVAVGKGPDIGISHQAKLPELYDLGVVTALDDAIAEVGLDLTAINPTSLAAATIDGSIYAIPLDTHPNVLFYNKDLLEGFLNEDGTLNENIIVPGARSSLYGGNWIAWSAFRNWDYQTLPAAENCIANYREIWTSMNDRSINNIMQSFTFDSTNYQNELAALQSVYDEYGKPLNLGFVDPATGLDEYIRMMEAAGLNTVMDAYLEQAAAYLESQN